MNELDVAIEAAEAAAAILRARGDGPRQVTHKGAVDLVTEVDRACEDAVRAVLARHTPDVPVLGEEGDPVSAPTRWVVDPLDGTTNFVHGFPYYAVSVALEIDGRAEVGVVHDPVRDRVYRAARGRGAWCGDARLQVSRVDTLDRALLGTGFAYDRRDRAAYYLAFYQAALERTQGVRRPGAAALDLAMVASGALDAFWEFTLHAWDVAAGMLLVQEAGGRATGLDGGPVDPEHPSPLASNGLLHDAMIAMLDEARARAEQESPTR